MENHLMFYIAEKKFCEEDPSLKRTLLLNNNYTRNYKSKNKLDIFSVSAINPSRSANVAKLDEGMH